MGDWLNEIDREIAKEPSKLRDTWVGKLRARLHAAEALEQYFDHTRDCRITTAHMGTFTLDGFLALRCTCGYDTARNAWLATKRGTDE